VTDVAPDGALAASVVNSFRITLVVDTVFAP